MWQGWAIRAPDPETHKKGTVPACYISELYCKGTSMHLYALTDFFTFLTNIIWSIWSHVNVGPHTHMQLFIYQCTAATKDVNPFLPQLETSFTSPMFHYQPHPPSATFCLQPHICSLTFVSNI